jgi:hypothetical protein
MSLYLIKSFKSAFNDAASKSGLLNDERDILNKRILAFVDFKLLFSKKIISTVYVSYDSRFFVDQKGYAELSNAIFEEFSIAIEPINRTIDIDCMIINTYHSFKDIMAQVKIIMATDEGKERNRQFFIQQRRSKKEREEIKERLYSPLPKSISLNKLIAIDFEYDQNKNHLIFECGITKYFNGHFQYEHYLIEENYKNKKDYELQLQFQFGNSIIVSMEHLLIILDNVLQETDYLIGHCVFSEYLVLKYHGLDILNFKQLTCMDTQKIFNAHFIFNPQYSQISLLHLLSLFDITPENLHNAGNDAAYTMMVFMKMVDTIYIKSKKNP